MMTLAPMFLSVSGHNCQNMYLFIYQVYYCIKPTSADHIPCNQQLPNHFRKPPSISFCIFTIAFE